MSISQNHKNSHNQHQLKETILQIIVQEKEAFLKNQQRNEDDLSSEQKHLLAEQLLNKNPSQFLFQYGKFLDNQMLKYFQESNKDDDKINLQIENFKKLNDAKLSKAIVKNRRFEALNRLISNGEYFSDSQMQIRNPLLFEQMVGRYMNDQERDEVAIENLLERHEKISFSSFLMEQIEKSHIEKKRLKQEEYENSLIEEEDSESDEEEDETEQNEENEENEQETEPNERYIKIDSNEKNMLREEFKKIMYEKFLSGEDAEYFDYSKVDSNVEFDSKVEDDRDEEDKYFDSEEAD